MVEIVGTLRKILRCAQDDRFPEIQNNDLHQMLKLLKIFFVFDKY
jgi:hypothetical protein